MRRGLVAALAISLVLAFLSIGSGLALLHGASEPVSEQAGWLGSLLAHPMEAAHAVAGHLTLALSVLISSMAFVLGLQGLLEPRGRRRLLAALLLAIAPLLMGLGLAADISGYLGGRSRAMAEELASGRSARFVEVHATQLSALLLGTLGAAALLISWMVKPRHDDEESDGV